MANGPLRALNKKVLHFEYSATKSPASVGGNMIVFRKEHALREFKVAPRIYGLFVLDRS